jgi:hypothetical protein
LFCYKIGDGRVWGENAKTEGREKKILLSGTKINGCDNLDEVTGFQIYCTGKKFLIIW